MCSENKLELTTLRKLPVGAAFVRHDEWGNGKWLLVKLSEEGMYGSKFFCWVGSPETGCTDYLVDDVQVQQIDVGETLQVILGRLAQSA